MANMGKISQVIGPVVDVTFETTPFCGVNKDNIYTSGDGKLNAAPVRYGDSVLLPSDD